MPTGGWLLATEDELLVTEELEDTGALLTTDEPEETGALLTDDATLLTEEGALLVEDGALELLTVELPTMPQGDGCELQVDGEIQLLLLSQPQPLVVLVQSG